MSKVLTGVGGLLVAVGIVVIQWSTPSPYGYMAPLVGSLLAVIGVVLGGIGLIRTYRP